MKKAPHFAWPDRLAKGQTAAEAAPPLEVPAGGGVLPALPPNSRSAWRSAGSKATKVVFQNTTGSAITVDWMDFEGRAKTYFTVAPGGQVESATYAGHVWRAKDQRGALLGYFVAGELPGTAIVKAADKR